MRVPGIALVFVVASSCRVVSSGACKVDADCLDGAVCESGLCLGGEVPTASFLAPDRVALGAVVTLDGSASRGAGGAPTKLNYRWSVSGPSGAALEGDDGPTPRLVASAPHGEYVVTLVVLDRGTASDPVSRTIAVANSRPVARLSSNPDDWPRAGTVSLSAAGSTDADGDTLEYTWELTKDPVNAPGTLAAGADGTATVTTGNGAGTYTVKVTVADAESSDTVSLVRGIENDPPVVSAGAAQTVDHACAVTLGGKLCTAEAVLTGTAVDPDGGSVAVTWTLKSAPPATRLREPPQLTVMSDGGRTSRVRLTAEPDAPFAGDYEFELEGTDSEGTKARASVIVTVGNRPPVLSIGSSGTRSIPHSFDDASASYVARLPVTLTVSDPDGDDVVRTFLPLNTELAGARSQLDVTGDSATYTLLVAVGNELSLIDGARVLHEVSVRAVDVNRAAVEARVPFLVENRPPVLENLTNLSTGGHSFSENLYSESFRWRPPIKGSDPDGDPVALSWEVSAPGVRFLEAEGRTTAPTLNELTLKSSEPQFVTQPISLTVTAVDGWSRPSQTVQLQAGNRAPVAPVFVSRTSPHRFGATAGCVNPSCYYADFDTKIDVTDPDGDPVTSQLFLVSPDPEFREVRTGTLASGNVRVSSPAGTLVAQPLVAKLQTADTFGSSDLQATWTLGNTAPVVTLHTPQTSDRHTYTTTSPRGYQHTFTAAVTASDADGDPLTDTWASASSAFVTTVQASGLLATKSVTLFSTDSRIVTGGANVTVTVSDGFASTGSNALYRMGNRTPTGVTGFANQTSTGHSYGSIPAGTGYSHTFSLALGLDDPDGDLPSAFAFSRNGGTSAATVGIEVIGSAGAPSGLRLSSTATTLIGGTIGIAATGSDVFGSTSPLTTRTFVISNRPPTVERADFGPASVSGNTVNAFCPSGSTCPIGNVCSTTTSARQFSGQAYLAPLVASGADPDNDPLTFTWDLSSTGQNQFISSSGAVGRSISSTAVAPGLSIGPSSSVRLGVPGTCSDAGKSATIAGTTKISLRASDGFAQSPVTEGSVQFP